MGGGQGGAFCGLVSVGGVAWGKLNYC